MTTVLLVLLGVVIVGAGLWLSVEVATSHEGFLGLLGFLAGIAVMFFGIFFPIWLGGGFEGPSDPCQYLISAKPVIYGHHQGWIDYGGRPVWCGPGPAPH